MQSASIFNGQYVVQKKISSGSFGIVLLGHDNENNIDVAIKVEKEENEEVRSLEREVQVLEKLNGVDGVPQMYWHGEQDDYNVVVMQLLGRDLAYFVKNKKKFTLKIVLQLGVDIVQVLERIHNCGVVHRDLKPENILFGTSEQINKIFVVDFGISKIYKDKHGNINPFRDNTSFIGTTRYASIAAHKGYELSRKDDLESLIYVLLYFLKGQLPWQNMQNVTDEERTVKVGEMKANMDPKDLCVNNVPIEFAFILEYLKTLEYKSQPEYQYLHKQFQQAAQKNGIILDGCYDWDQQMKVSQEIKHQEGVQRSVTLNQQLQPPNTQEMKKSQGSAFQRQMSNNQFLIPPSGNSLQPPNVLKRQDSQQPSVVSGSVMLSTYNSIRPRYQGSQLAFDQVKMSIDSIPQDQEMKKTAETGQKIGVQNPYTETVGWRDSIFEENFDEIPLSKKYSALKSKSVAIPRKSVRTAKVSSKNQQNQINQ